MTTRYLSILLISIFLFSAGIDLLTAKPLKIVSNRKSDYCILIENDADSVIRFAASQLQEYIHRMTGTLLPVKTNSTKDPYIAVKQQEHNQHLSDNLKLDDGYSIRFDGLNIIIEGTGSRGTLYGVYNFIEKLGCRWYSPGIEALKPFAEKIPVFK